MAVGDAAEAAAVEGVAGARAVAPMPRTDLAAMRTSAAAAAETAMGDRCSNVA